MKYFIVNVYERRNDKYHLDHITTTYGEQIEQARHGIKGLRKGQITAMTEISKQEYESMRWL